MISSRDIRQQYIDFFVKRHRHTFVPSAPVVPHDDPTLLFTNAGMNQFKPIFLGQETRAYTRAVNTQKCIRAGGKHNDLDDVGRSRRHGTFFEMLGNWSFGDYFKRGAIEMAWELMTKVWKLDASRLHVTCYEGDERNGVPRDTEAANLWKEIAGLPDDHIHFLGKSNFWEMGDTGPCGPSSEIFFDRTPRATGGPSVVKDDDPRVMEFWNLVFIQYNRNADQSLTPLPAQHVDTGMGFERICSSMQDKEDMYGIDLFDPFFKAISELSGFQYSGKFPKSNAPDPAAEAASPELRHDIAFRVIADHLRTLTFAIADGAAPSNEGRGYVLRRILRRAVRFGRQQLELRKPFMHKLVPVVVDAMGHAFPEIREKQKHVVELVRDEEISFGKTLDRGIQLFEEAATKRRSDEATKGSISADDAFKLHDTYGFPVDLTRIMAEERGMSVDIAGYEKLMEQARELARAGGKAQASKVFMLSPDALGELARQNIRPTDDSAKFSRESLSAKVFAIWNGDDLGLSPASVFEDEELAVILDRTNFYAEMGGQVCDSGLIASANSQFDVETTRVVGSYILHIGRVRSGKIRVGDSVNLLVSPHREATEKNHTTTHLANWALREVLGDAVQQKGSLVDPEKLRFDFSHGKAMSDDEIARVESLVIERIVKSQSVYAEVAPQEQALKINGLRAVFGEKYPPMVRVVSIGVPVKELLSDPTNAKWREFSIEFCGGTHLKSSGDAKSFVITAEEAISKGIRRLVALTGEPGKAASSAGSELDSQIARAEKTADASLPSVISSIQKSLEGDRLPLRAKRRAQTAVAALQSRYKAFQKSSKSESAATIDVAALATELLSQAAGPVIVADIPGAGDDQLRSIIDSLKKRSPSIAVLLATVVGEKVAFVSAVSDDLIGKGLKAGEWIRATAKVAGGGGGGSPQMAQAGGKDPSKLSEALATARDVAAAIIK
ncbi:alanine--tRNA ligase [soil metagenome]